MRLLSSLLAVLLFSLSGCGDGTGGTPDTGKASTDTNAATDAAATADVTIPPYEVVKSNVDGKDNSYSVQVGDTLPDEKQSIAIARKVAGIENMPSVNTAVYITRAGFSALASTHAHVIFLKSADKPEYGLQSADNELLKKVSALTFDSIPNKKLIVECLEAAGAKIFFYQKSAGGYFRVIMFGSGGYEIDPIIGEKNGQVFTETEDGEKFTYKLDETGMTMDVYNGNNSLFNSYKVLRKG